MNEEQLRKKQEIQAMAAQVIRQFVPPWILHADKRGPGFLAGSEDGKAGGDPDSVYLGFIANHCAWKQFRGAAPQEEECKVTVSGDTFTVSSGELVVGKNPENRLSVPECNADGSAASVGDQRWVYLEMDADNFLGTIKGGITADAYKALDSFTDTQQLYRCNLSKWKKTAKGWVFICKAHPSLHQHGTVAG